MVKNILIFKNFFFKDKEEKKRENGHKFKFSPLFHWYTLSNTLPSRFYILIPVTDNIWHHYYCSCSLSPSLSLLLTGVTMHLLYNKTTFFLSINFNFSLGTNPSPPQELYPNSYFVTSQVLVPYKKYPLHIVRWLAFEKVSDCENHAKTVWSLVQSSGLLAPFKLSNSCQHEGHMLNDDRTEVSWR